MRNGKKGIAFIWKLDNAGMMLRSNVKSDTFHKADLDCIDSLGGGGE